MRDTNVPSSTVVRIVASKDIHKRVNGNIENVTLAPRIDFHFCAVRPNANDSASTSAECCAVFGRNGFDESKVADSDINPAIDSHPDAVRRVVGSTFCDFVRTDSVDQHFAVVRSSISVTIMKHTQIRRV